MRVLVLIASDTAATGAPVMAAGDRAAVQWGLAHAADDCHVRYPQGDIVAATYAMAVGTAAGSDIAENRPGGVTGCDSAIDNSPAVSRLARAKPMALRHPSVPVTRGGWTDAERLPADLVLIGPGAIDHWGDGLAGQLAERLSAELVFDVVGMERDGTDWRVVCDAGHGAQDVLRIAGRLVAVLSEDVPRPTYLSSYRRRQAARHVALQPAAAAPGEWQPAQPRRKRSVAAAVAAADDRVNAMFGISEAAGDSRSRQAIVDTPAVCAQVLLRYLVHHGFVDRKVAALTSPAPKEPVADSTRQPTAGTAPPPHSYSPALLRSPRRSDESEWRRARRPRPATAALPLTSAPDAAALRRRPRRMDSRTAAAPRGPFRVWSSSNLSVTAAPKDTPIPPTT